MFYILHLITMELLLLFFSYIKTYINTNYNKATKINEKISRITRRNERNLKKYKIIQKIESRDD